MKVFTKETTKELMLKHYPTVTIDRGASYAYCACGIFINFVENYPEHVDKVLRRTKGA